MDRLDIYLEIVPLPVVVAAAIFAILAFLAIPAQYRLFIALVFVPIWLTVGRMQDIGIIAQAAKISSSMVFFLVGMGALMHPGPRRKIPPIIWLYLVMAAVMFVYVLQVQDRTIAMILRVQWFMLVFAAIMLVRTIVTVQDLMRIINALVVGCFFALLLPLSGLILFPRESFLRGASRFQPYGVNSNQIGMLFALSLPLLTYKAITTRSFSLKPILFCAVGITLGMALLTGSRQTMLAIVMVSLPLVFRLSKRPIITMIALAVGFFAVTYVISLAADQAGFERLTSLESSRMDIWPLYFRDVFSERPIFGLLGVSDQLAFKSSIVGQHPHSAYFNLMYMGGLSLVIPMMILLVISLISTYRVWKMRYELGTDPFLISVLAMLLLAMYTQGTFNQVVYWPTYNWAFLHVILAGFFIAIAADLKQEDPAFVLPDLDEDSWEEPDWEDLEESVVQGY